MRSVHSVLKISIIVLKSETLADTYSNHLYWYNTYEPDEEEIRNNQEKVLISNKIGNLENLCALLCWLRYPCHCQIDNNKLSQMVYSEAKEITERSFQGLEQIFL